MRLDGLPLKKQIMSLLLLSVLLLMTACASGMTKTEGLTIDPSYIESVRKNCSASFPPAKSGTVESLWENKRAILRQSRNCGEASRLLADLAENRNKVIGE